MRDMLLYERGLAMNVTPILEVLQDPPNIPEDRRESFLLNAASKLHLVLTNINFDPGDLPVSPPGDEFDLTLGDLDGHRMTFKMVRLSNGKWGFSAETLEDPELSRIFEEIEARYDKLTHADADGDTFITDYMSPYRTGITFYEGINAESGYTMADAVGALDLSEMDPIIRNYLGPVRAVQLYRVAKFLSPVDVEQLSADPQATRQPIILFIPNKGVVALHVVTDKENDLKAWKLTPNSITLAKDIYGQTMADGMAEWVAENRRDIRGRDLPLYILIDDWVQIHSPGLQTAYLGVKLWKWFVLVSMLLATPLVIIPIRWITKILIHILRAIIKHEIGFRHPRLLYSIYVFVVAVIWEHGLILITTNQTLLKIGVITVDILRIGALALFCCWIVAAISRGLQDKGIGKVRNTAIRVISQVINTLIVLLALIAVAKVFGQDTTRILTALGIGGLALALAGKDTVENILGTVMILSTRPFAIGDWILVSGTEGTVENVGLRSTSIRTFYDSLVSMPNRTFIVTPVDNMGRRAYRRYRGTVGIAYDTPDTLVEAFLSGMRNLVLNHPKTRKDYFHIRLNEFGDSSLDIMIYIFFKTEDWTAELEERERFILDVVRLARKLGVEFAFPTSTVHLHRGEDNAYDPPSDTESANQIGKDLAQMLVQKDASGKS